MKEKKNFMKGMPKRIMAFVMTFAMAMTSLMIAPTKADAATSHVHTSYTEMTTSNASSFRDLYSSSNGMKIGTYYLNSSTIDAIAHAGCTQSWYQYEKTGTYTICLNGNTLKNSKSGYSAYAVSDSAKSVLENCKSTGGIWAQGQAISVGANATLDIKDTISIHSEGSYGIYLQPGCVVTIPSQIDFDTPSGNFYFNYNYGTKPIIKLSEVMTNTTPYSIDIMDYSDNVKNNSPSEPYVFTEGWTSIMGDAEISDYFVTASTLGENYKIVKYNGELALQYSVPPSMSATVADNPAAITYGTAVSDVEVATMQLTNFDEEPTSYTTSWYTSASSGTALAASAKKPTATVNAETKKVTVSTTADVPAGTYYLQVNTGDVDSSNRIPVVVGKATISDELKTTSTKIGASSGEKAIVTLPSDYTYGSPESSCSKVSVAINSDKVLTITATADLSQQADFTITIPVTNSTNYVTPFNYTVSVSVHKHSFSYSVPESAKNTIVATCSCAADAAGCSLAGKAEAERTYTLTLNAPIATVYTGEAITCSVDDTAWKGMFGNDSVPAIKYYGRDNTSDPASNAAPVSVGKYTAKITADTNKTAAIDFEITKQSAPAAPENLTSTKPQYIQGDDGKISGVDSTMEYSTDDGATWKAVEGTEITGLSAGTVKVRLKETETKEAGVPATVIVAAGTEKRPAPKAPANLSVTSTLDKSATDGKITGVDSTMEYSTDDGQTWKAVEGTEITGLSVGSVKVRLKETDLANASEIATIIVDVHTHAKGKAHAEVAATEKAEGTKAYYDCIHNGCNVKLDAKGNEVKDADLVIAKIEKKEEPSKTEAKPNKSQVKKNELDVNSKFKVITYNDKIKVVWGTVKGADGYKVYITYCGKKMSAKPIAIASAKDTSVTFKKLLGKKINPKQHIKVYVEAYKKGEKADISLGKTITAHAVGKKNKTATDAKKIVLKKTSYTLNVGKKASVKATTVKKNPKKDLLTHTKEFRYATTDSSVATVSSKGKITAKGKGTCYVYVYAVNGYAKKIKVTVK